MTAIESLPVPLLAYMRSYARRRRWQRLIVRLGLAMLAFLGVALLACLVDRLIALPAPLRAAALIGDLLIAGLIAWPALRECFAAQTDWRRLAHQLERHDPILSERLLTIVSRLLGKQEQTGSRPMLERIARELSVDVDGRDVSALLPARSVARPWAAVAILAIIILFLSMIPVLDLPALATRFTMPWKDTPPVTTTRLTVTPGNVDLVEGQPLQVKVFARRLRSGVPLLQLRRNGQQWTSNAMSPDLDGNFVTALGEVDDDLQYAISGGDARSDIFTVRVLRKPVVSDFAIHYEYPGYTGLPPADVTNRTGLIEAPAGTKATIRLRASEALSAATMTVGEKTVPMTQVGGDSLLREATFTITRNLKYQLGLSSTRGMVGAGPDTAMIRVTPDKPPEVRILWPTGDLWLEPASILTIGYEAKDDFGLAQLEVHARVNPFGADAADPAHAQPPGRMFRAPVDLTVPLRGSPRRQVAQFPLDLAALDIRPGDFLTLRLRAVDHNGQSATSDTIQVIASPRSVPWAQRLGADALERAAQIAEGLASGSRGPARDRADSLATAADRLQLWLMRALISSASGRDADVIQSLVDRAAQIVSLSPRLDTSQAQDQVQFDAFVRQTAEAIRATCQARRASLLLVDLENAAAVRRTLPTGNAPPATQARRRVDTLDEQIRAGLRELRLRPADPQLSQRLRQKATAWTDLPSLESEDLTNLAARWIDGISKGQHDPTFLDRLDAAARAQTIRPDGDPVWARDLQRAATAGRIIETAGVSSPGGAAARFASVLGALQRDYRMRGWNQRGPSQQSESDETASARQQLAEWASETPANSTAARQFESLVMQANAETVLRNFSNALAIDRALMAETTPAARASTASQFAAAETDQTMDLIQTLDALVLRQEAVERQLEQAAGSGVSLDTLVDQQRKLAQAITQLTNDQSRPDEQQRLDAATRIASLDGWLATLPTELISHNRLSEMPYELEDQAERIREINGVLSRFTNVTGPAITQVRDRLLPAVLTLQSAAQDARQAPTAVAELPALVDETRSALTDASDAILRADPLIAAQFRSTRAAAMLAQNHVELGPALQELSDAATALRRAWREAIHRVAVARSMQLPTLSRVAWPNAQDQDDSAWNGAEAPRAKPVDPGPIPQGYEDAVSAFMEATSQRKPPAKPK